MAAKPQTTGASDPREDLDILLPDATVHVGGRDVTVRELRFAESLEATPIARPIIEAVRAQVEIHGVTRALRGVAIGEDIDGRPA